MVLLLQNLGRIGKGGLAVLVLLTLVLTLTGCNSNSPVDSPLIPVTAPDGAPARSLSLTSPAFAQGQPIPAKYSCQGQDISPPLTWGSLPAGTQSAALIMDDPDAPGGTWVHWVLYNLASSSQGLPEAVPPTLDGPGGSRQGNNSWQKPGYGGSCPPDGTHRYFFKLYALDIMVNLPAGAAKEQLLKAMQGHILGQGELMGTYRKS